MKISSNGIDLIKQFEGLKLKAYLCPANVWTIGYGHTKNVKANECISEKTALNFLKNDLIIFEDSINNLVKVNLNQNQFDALVSFVFNIGISNFKKSTILKLINMSDFNLASQQFDKWIYINGKISKGLVKRRQIEKSLFIS